MSERASVAAYATTVADHFGRVNVIVNNAGVALSGDFADLAYEDLDWIMGVNFWGVVHGTKEFLPHLIASGDGHVVNMSSLFGLVSVPGQSAYNATKYAVRGLSEAVRQEMLIAGHPVRRDGGPPGRHQDRDRPERARRRGGRPGRGGRALRREARLDGAGPGGPRSSSRAVLANKARALVGLDAHAIHQVAKLAGSRYQDVIAYAGRRGRLTGG